jgi:hypothetical protein
MFDGNDPDGRLHRGIMDGTGNLGALRRPDNQMNQVGGSSRLTLAQYARLPAAGHSQSLPNG